jgi:hypothetical protein
VPDEIDEFCAQIPVEDPVEVYGVDEKLVTKFDRMNLELQATRTDGTCQADALAKAHGRDVDAGKNSQKSSPTDDTN